MLVLIRHGQSTGNADGLLVGRTDLPLTHLGIEQATSAGAALGSVTTLISSPLQRAQATALHLGLEVAPTIDDRWVEVDYGSYDGVALADVPRDVWREWRTNPAFAPQGGESLVVLEERVAAALEELFGTDGEGARDRSGDVVVVSHVSPIKAAVAWALGCDPLVAFRLHLSNASLTTIGWGPAGPVLHAYNVSPRVGSGQLS